MSVTCACVRARKKGKEKREECKENWVCGSYVRTYQGKCTFFFFYMYIFSFILSLFLCTFLHSFVAFLHFPSHDSLPLFSFSFVLSHLLFFSLILSFNSFSHTFSLSFIIYTAHSQPDNLLFATPEASRIVIADVSIIGRKKKCSNVRDKVRKRLAEGEKKKRAILKDCYRKR